jgi:hypothetical protein
LWAEYGDEVQFFVVYIREAHAIDSPVPLTGESAPKVEDPMHLGERRAVAEVCMRAIDLVDLPNLVDDVDDAVSRAYQAWPDRLVLVGRDGRVAYQGLPGPWGLDPDELEQAILRETRPK